MEDWQRSHIRQQCAKLIELTDCHAQFLSELQKFQCLSTSDEDILVSLVNNYPVHTTLKIVIINYFKAECNTTVQRQT